MAKARRELNKRRNLVYRQHVERSCPLLAKRALLQLETLTDDIQENLSSLDISKDDREIITSYVALRRSEIASWQREFERWTNDDLLYYADDRLFLIKRLRS